MKEAFLQYVWRNRLFRDEGLRTTAGEPLRIQFPGYPNSDAGPDFRQAVIQIGDITWAGDVEIHIRSSDWYRHRHQEDAKYRSVILHVVYEHDVEVVRRPNECYPTLELRGRVPEEIFRRCDELVGSPELLACRSKIKLCDPLTLQALVSSMAMERLLRKQAWVHDTVRQCQGNWHEALYRLLAVSFGFKTNGDAFELLARSLPYRILSRHLDSALQVNALLFGQAGMLETPLGDSYYSKLKYEYDYLRYKYNLQPIGEERWNLLRLRPSNFPCLRIAQLAALLTRDKKLLDTLLHTDDLGKLRERFAVSADLYWRTHYHFGRETAPHGVVLGASTVDSLLINTVVPFLFAHHKFFGEEARLESVMSVWERLPFEDNRLTRVCTGTPIPRTSALDSQAIMELLGEYCTKKRCMECTVGDRIIQQKGPDGGLMRIV
ncbi:MAG: DUF2851 family protein [Bacteroidales bacterium]|nr:DUF2851 family protein [Bacteroidales bacterium]